MKLTNLYRKTFRKPIKLYWWRYQHPDKLNFGDEITPYIIKKIFGYRSVWAAPGECDLVGVGSVIEHLQEVPTDKHIKIWGSGFIKSGGKNTHKNLEFLAVRGKLSRARVDSGNVALGDPGLLMPLAFKPKTGKKYRLGIVPHYADQNATVVQKMREKKGVKIIDVLGPIEKVIEDIASCELILSSSLHGLIVSDAYGVPNYWMPLSDNLTGGDYKFKDYYSIFNETPGPLALKNLEKLDVDKLINEYKPKDVGAIQKNLLEAFPF